MYIYINTGALPALRAVRIRRQTKVANLKVNTTVRTVFK